MLTNEDCFVPGRGGAGLPVTAPVLKPSQAMRIGAASMGASCALGAMFEGYGGAYGASDSEVFAFDDDSLVRTVWLNGWTREQIADWLEERGL